MRRPFLDLAARLGRGLAGWAPAVVLALAAVLLFDAAQALAQSTGGSFGGGSFGGGGGGGYSGGSGGGDGGEDIFWIVVWILSSRLPWPIKLGLVGLVVVGWVGYRFAKRRSDRRRADDASDGEDR